MPPGGLATLRLPGQLTTFAPSACKSSPLPCASGRPLSRSQFRTRGAIQLINGLLTSADGSSTSAFHSRTSLPE